MATCGSCGWSLTNGHHCANPQCGLKPSAYTTGSDKSKCFAADTPVLTSVGSMPISQVRVGDLVTSYSKSQETTLRRVLEVRGTDIGRAWFVFFDAEDEPLKVSKYHSILTVRGYRMVFQLKTGMEVLHFDGDKLIGTRRVSKVMTNRTPERLYNLVTEGEHNFVCSGLVAHNFSFAHEIRAWMYSRKVASRMWRKPIRASA